MSDTPKTDANCGWPVGHHGRIESSDLRWSPDGPFVHSEVARHLERENAALRAAIAESEEFAKKNGETCGLKIRDLLSENAALRVALEDIMTESDEQHIWRMARAALQKEAQP